MKEELEALYEENRELHRQLAMVEHKCKQIIKFGFAASGFAKQILKIMGVEV
jgi:hypothetical protein